MGTQFTPDSAVHLYIFKYWMRAYFYDAAIMYHYALTLSHDMTVLNENLCMAEAELEPNDPVI